MLRLSQHTRTKEFLGPPQQGPSQPTSESTCGGTRDNQGHSAHASAGPARHDLTGVPARKTAERARPRRPRPPRDRRRVRLRVRGPGRVGWDFAGTQTAEGRIAETRRQHVETTLVRFSGHPRHLCSNPGAPPSCPPPMQRLQEGWLCSRRSTAVASVGCLTFFGGYGTCARCCC